MENFSHDDVKSRQTKAERELFEMWKKSTAPSIPPYMRGTSMPQNNLKEEEVKCENPKEEETEKVQDDMPKTPIRGGLLGKDILKLLNLDSLQMNSDRMLLLLMIVLLSGEDSDNILLFALAYIML